MPYPSGVSHPDAAELIPRIKSPRSSSISRGKTVNHPPRQGKTRTGVSTRTFSTNSRAAAGGRKRPSSPAAWQDTARPPERAEKNPAPDQRAELLPLRDLAG